MDDSDSFVAAYEVDKYVTVYSKVVWLNNEDLFKIDINNQNNWWTGTFTKKSAETYQQQVDDDNYSKNCKAILQGSTTFSKYEFAMGDTTSLFSWKRVFEDGTVILYGCVQLRKVEEIKTENPLIDFLIHENNKLKKAVDNYELNIVAMKTELELCKSELEKFVNVKSSLERSVYGKFVSLLNSKKRRIQVLEQNIQELENGN